MLTKISEDWKSPDNFYIYFQINVEINEKEGNYELFSFIVVSPKRLEGIVTERGIEIGRGYLIMNDFDVNIVEMTVKRLINLCKTNNSEQTITNLSKFFKWEMDTI